MNLATNVRPISYLKNHAVELVQQLASGEPMLLTDKGEGRLVVMDVRAYEQREQILALLKVLALGNREIEQGRVQDADSVFDELEALDQAISA